MKCTVKKCEFALIAVVIFIACVGCTARGKSRVPSVLWVVTEETKWDGMNALAKQLAEVFEAEHPGFTVKLDILPQDEVARAGYMKQIRTEIMSGKGPDVYLLPTTSTFLGNGIDEAPKQSQITDLKPLFPNVEQAMRNGMFLDFGSWYDADTILEKECFQPTIMEAGVICENTRHDGRYLLPLRYNFPVLYVDVGELAKYGLTVEDVSGSVFDLMELAIQSGSQELACAVEPHVLLTGQGFSFLSQAIDYNTGRVTVTKEEIAQLLRLFQQLETLVKGETDQRVPINIGNLNWPMIAIDSNNPYINGDYEASLRPMRNFPYEFPMRLGSLEDGIMLYAIDKTNERKLQAVPVRDNDGNLTAYVSYYGAIGAGCKKTNEAYEYLRMFLSEDAQYANHRPYKRDFMFGTVSWPDLIEDGLPVRVVGGANGVWVNLRSSARWLHSGYLNLNRLSRMSITDEDVPLLKTEIDRVYFGNVLEQQLAQMVRSLNDPNTGEPTDVDIDALAEHFIEELQWQVLEG